MSWSWLWWPVDEVYFAFTHQGLQLPLVAVYAYAVHQYRVLEGLLGLESRHHRRRWRAISWLILWLVVGNVLFNVVAHFGGWPRGLVAHYRLVGRLEDRVAECAALMESTAEALEKRNQAEAKLPEWLDPKPTEKWLHFARIVAEHGELEVGRREFGEDGCDAGHCFEAVAEFTENYGLAMLAAALRQVALENGSTPRTEPIDLLEAVRIGSRGLGQIEFVQPSVREIARVVQPGGKIPPCDRSRAGVLYYQLDADDGEPRYFVCRGVLGWQSLLEPDDLLPALAEAEARLQATRIEP